MRLVRWLLGRDGCSGGAAAQIGGALVWSGALSRASCASERRVACSGRLTHACLASRAVRRSVQARGEDAWGGGPAAGESESVLTRATTHGGPCTSDVSEPRGVGTGVRLGEGERIQRGERAACTMCRKSVHPSAILFHTSHTDAIPRTAPRASRLALRSTRAPHATRSPRLSGVALHSPAPRPRSRVSPL